MNFRSRGQTRFLTRFFLNQDPIQKKKEVECRGGEGGERRREGEEGRTDGQTGWREIETHGINFSQRTGTRGREKEREI